MTLDVLEERLRELDVDAPDAGRVAAKVLARHSRKRSLRIPRSVTVPAAVALLVVIVAYFVPAADLAVAEKAPWGGEVVQWAGLVGAKDRITVVDETANSSGVRVTLQGAYADATRTVLLMHTDPAAMPDGFSTSLTDQFARSYRLGGASANALTGDMALHFEALAFPDAITGARITLHMSRLETTPGQIVNGTWEPSPRQVVTGTWELAAALGVDQARTLPAPAPADLGPAHFRFTSVTYTPATIDVEIEVTGVSSGELSRVIPNGLKGEFALVVEIIDPNGDQIGGSLGASGDQSTSRVQAEAYRESGPGRYLVRVSYYGYGSFDRTLNIPS